MIATSDYELVTEGVGLVDRSDRAKFLVRGGEAADFLQGQVSNDVEALEPGSGCYATVLSHKGKLRTDLRILRGDDWFWLDTEAIGHAVLEHMLRTKSLGRDVQYEDVTESRSLLSLLGPASRERLDAAPPDEENAFVTGKHGIYITTLLGADVVGERGMQLGVEPVSDEAAECVRIEAGRPRLGYDMDAETMPQEAGINERAVSFTKGCYVGQETVARLHYKGKPNRHLRGLRLSEPAERGAEILLGGKVVGRVGSTCVSPRLGPIALALVRREAEPGATVTVGEATAEVVALPFSA
ncbi:MAG TPA: glycine cleavage T C-terminal barrel domain-containing protein [Thermoleophilaceae bacterium]|nr:glycine cleavage T C-terminal barrel domain-containing protein [Thermoleophilaceae bacterium]